MRLNKYIAAATGLSRRAADNAVAHNRVLVNGIPPTPGQQITDKDVVNLDSKNLESPSTTRTILLNKPIGYVCSRDGQGSSTVYELIPVELHDLKPVGRLDKDTSGLLLMTTDGNLAYQLTHPSFEKTKVYEIVLNKSLEPLHRQMISDHGLVLDDGPSKLLLARLHDGDDNAWSVTMHEGRNRQIRRTFEALGYTVTTLHRTQFGNYNLAGVKTGSYKPV